MIVLMYIVCRQRRGHCDFFPCVWTSLGWYRLEDNKGWRGCYICRGLQPSKREVIFALFFSTASGNLVSCMCRWCFGIEIDDFELLTAVIFIRHLNGINQSAFVRPAVLITDAYNALNNQPYRRQKDKEFTGLLTTLTNQELKFFLLFIISVFPVAEHVWNKQLSIWGSFIL